MFVLIESYQVMDTDNDTREGLSYRYTIKRKIKRCVLAFAFLIILKIWLQLSCYDTMHSLSKPSKIQLFQNQVWMVRVTQSKTTKRQKKMVKKNTYSKKKYGTTGGKGSVHSHKTQSLRIIHRLFVCCFFLSLCVFPFLYRKRIKEICRHKEDIWRNYLLLVRRKLTYNLKVKSLERRRKSLDIQTQTEGKAYTAFIILLKL